MAAPIRILRFWEEYQKRNGEIVPVDMVEYCAPGMAQRSTTVAVVANLKKIRTDIDPDNPAFLMARERWAAIEPAYAAWKAGQETPANGTPFGAWAGITPQQAEVLRTFGFRSVEEIAEASDGVLSRVQLPGIRDLATNAKNWLASRDQVAVSETMSKMQAENAELRDQIEEMRQMLVEMSQRKEPDLEADGSEAPRRRGRPPKVRDEVETGIEAEAAA